MAYVCTKFENSSFTRSNDMKEDPKRKTGWIWGSLGSLKVIGNAVIRQSAYYFPSSFHRIYVSILCRFRDSELFVESKKYFLHCTYTRPPIRETLLAYQQDVWYVESRSLPCGVACVIMFSCCDRTPACDGHTDRHVAISGHRIYRAGIASRGKNPIIP